MSPENELFKPGEVETLSLEAIAKREVMERVGCQMEHLSDASNNVVQGIRDTLLTNYMEERGEFIQEALVEIGEITGQSTSG